MNKYTKTYTITLYDTNARTLRLRPISAIMYFQETFARYCASRRMAGYDLILENQIWVISEINMEIVGDLPFWSEEFKVEIWFSDISKIKAYADFNICYKDNVVAKGNIMYILLNATTRRPVKTDELLSKFEVCNELALGEHTKMVLPQFTEQYTKIAHTNSSSDIDFNKHVNNKVYINLAEMTVPDELKQTHALKSIRIRFNRETFLGDTLHCTAYKTALPDTYAHIIEKDGVSVCDIVTSWKEHKENVNIVDYDLDIRKENK